MSGGGLEPTTSYRLFKTNARGHIDSVALEIVASSDEDAIAQSKRLLGSLTFELWDGGRRVATEGHRERDSDQFGSISP